MNNESLVLAIKKRHSLCGLHLFDQGAGWTVFGFRKNAQGYNASVESGRGGTIRDALDDLDRRLIEGPIHNRSLT